MQDRAAMTCRRRFDAFVRRWARLAQRHAAGFLRLFPRRVAVTGLVVCALASADARAGPVSSAWLLPSLAASASYGAAVADSADDAVVSGPSGQHGVRRLLALDGLRSPVVLPNVVPAEWAAASDRIAL